MKKLFISFTALLLTAAVVGHASQRAAAATTPIGSLTVDSVVIWGNLLAGLAQRIEVGMHNPSATDYEGRLYLLAYNKGDGRLTTCMDTLFSLKSHSGHSLLLYPSLPEGELELRVTADAEGRQVLGGCEVTVLPLRQLDFRTTFSLDMLTEADDGIQVVYGSRIRGRVRMVNHDGPYYGVHGGAGDDDGLVLWLEDSDSGERIFSRHIADRLEPWAVAEQTFSHDAVFREGGRYALKAGYTMPYGLEPADSLCFTTRSGTNTYWTAEGHVLPLPVGDSQQLTVPAEAVAVDLRGQVLQRPQSLEASPTTEEHSPLSVDASQANPNCLFYLDQTGSIPEGLDEGRNIIRGLEAENIKLTEAYDYYCPLAFRTQFVSFLMKPSYDRPDDELRGRGYSETLVLPFYPRYANLYDVNGGNTMLHSDMLKVLRYYGNDGDSLTIVQLNSISEMHAYEPYILGVYIGSQLLFIGENTTVPVTREAIVRGKDVNFVGTTVARQLPSPAYQYNADDNHFYPSNARIAPFRAYMYSENTASSLYFSDGVWGAEGKPGDATAIDDIPIYDLPIYDLRFDSDVVCDLSGRQLSNSKSSNRQIPKGIYIVGGRKVVVK